MERLERAVKAANADYERFLEPKVLLLFARGMPLGCWKADPVDVTFPKTVEALTSACKWWQEVGADTIVQETLPRAEDFKEKFFALRTGGGPGAAGFACCFARHAGSPGLGPTRAHAATCLSADVLLFRPCRARASRKRLCTTWRPTPGMIRQHSSV